MAKSTKGAKPKRAEWSLDEARAKLDEVVRRAKSAPHYVVVRGRRKVAIIEADALDQLMSGKIAELPLSEFLECLHTPGLDLEREADFGRDVAL